MIQWRKLPTTTIDYTTSMQLVPCCVKMATLTGKIMTKDDSQENEDQTLLPEPSECTYTSCYCEENVWHLCDSVRKRLLAELNNCYCVFISNSERVVPLWCQRASTQEDGCVLWDYHVIFVYKCKSKTEVYDLDSTQKFPSPFQEYVEKGIRSDGPIKPAYRRLFRVIPALTFLETFASDRSHMLDPDGKWMKPPPAYPCLQTQASTNNIQDFINMDVKKGEGKVLNFWEFCEFFMPPRSPGK